MRIARAFLRENQKRHAMRFHLSVETCNFHRGTAVAMSMARFSLILTVVLVAVRGANAAGGRRDLLNSPAGAQRAGKHNADFRECKKVLGNEDIMQACDHEINPSGIVYQPSLQRLFVVGQEYIVHLTERRRPDGEIDSYDLDGCYFGAKQTLGRGDGEAAAGLDFALPEPSRQNRRWHRNWLLLDRMKHYIMMVEENFHEPVVYLIDTRRLGKGYVRSTAATVHKFPIPLKQYPEQLEGLAFVPDLDDDLYLGTLILGTQQGYVQACKVPLVDWSLPVICPRRQARFPFSIDSLEYDPTFMVKPGAYGSLLMGSGRSNAAVFIDPYMVANEPDRKDTEVTQSFELMQGNVAGLDMMDGIEGMHIYDDRVYFAIDRNPSGKQLSRVGGVIWCYYTKPESITDRVSGWHPQARTFPGKDQEDGVKPQAEGLAVAGFPDCKYC